MTFIIYVFENMINIYTNSNYWNLYKIIIKGKNGGKRAW